MLANTPPNAVVLKPASHFDSARSVQRRFHNALLPGEFRSAASTSRGQRGRLRRRGHFQPFGEVFVRTRMLRRPRERNDDNETFIILYVYFTCLTTTLYAIEYIILYKSKSKRNDYNNRFQ